MSRDLHKISIILYDLNGVRYRTAKARCEDGFVHKQVRNIVHLSGSGCDKVAIIYLMQELTYIGPQ